MPSKQIENRRGRENWHRKLSVLAELFPTYFFLPLLLNLLVCSPSTTIFTMSVLLVSAWEQQTTIERVENLFTIAIGVGLLVACALQIHSERVRTRYLSSYGGSYASKARTGIDGKTPRLVSLSFPFRLSRVFFVFEYILFSSSLCPMSTDRLSTAPIHDIAFPP